MAEAEKPNILVIGCDDIGITNLSCYSDGLMGYRTPNIDRIANEGMRFTDSYGEQSCTAGRSAFITGQSVFRTGLSKVGAPHRHSVPVATPSVPRSPSPAQRPMGMDHISLILRAVRPALISFKITACVARVMPGGIGLPLALAIRSAS